MIKIPFNEKEYKKQQKALEQDLARKFEAMTPEAFIEKIKEVEVIKEIEVEKIVEVDNPKHLEEIKHLKAQLEHLSTERGEQLEARLEAEKENEKLKANITALNEINSKLKKALNELSVQ